MITPELIAFVRQQTSQGVSPDTIKSTLQSQGWNESDISEALKQADQPSVAPQSQTPTPSARPHHSRTLLFSIAGILLITGVAYAITVSNPAYKERKQKEELVRLLEASNAQTKTEKQNCGSVDALHADPVSGYEKATSEEIAATACMSAALASCTPASLTVTSPPVKEGEYYLSTGSYSIDGKSGSDCLITDTKERSGAQKIRTCKLPLPLVGKMMGTFSAERTFLEMIDYLEQPAESKLYINFPNSDETWVECAV